MYKGTNTKTRAPACLYIYIYEFVLYGNMVSGQFGFPVYSLNGGMYFIRPC